MTSNTTVDPAEVEKFAALAAVWWDQAGPFKPLHRLNPVRLRFIRDRLARRFGRDVNAERPLAGLHIIDIGCGGGLLAEPLTRLGASVTGIDATEKNISIARIHAAEMGLDIDYRVATAESLADAGERFDAVLNMEVIEHVANVGLFLAATAELTKPGGAMFLATLNRTAKSYALAIIGAEYLLRWLPKGTHDWQRFVKPSELASGLRSTGMAIAEMTGVVYNPFSDRWSLDTNDLAVNYMAVAEWRPVETGPDGNSVIR